MIELILAHKYERKRIRDWADWMVSEKLEMGGRLAASRAKILIGAAASDKIGPL